MRMIVGREAPAVYWRRRALVLGVVLVLVLLASYACGGSSGDEGAAETTADSAALVPPEPPPTSASPTPEVKRPVVKDSPKPPPVTSPPAPAPASASPTPGTIAGGPCANADLRLTPAPSATSVPKGGYLGITFTVTNAATVPCTRDLGVKAVEIQIRAGDQRLWSTLDCGSDDGGAAGTRTLQPGESATSQATWSGKTSTPDCKKAAKTVPKGRYQILGRVGDAWSAPIEFSVT